MSKPAASPTITAISLTALCFQKLIFEQMFDLVREYLMATLPYLIAKMVFISCLVTILLVSLSKWLPQYLEQEKWKKWRFTLTYTLPVIVIAFAFASIISDLKPKEAVLTSPDKLKPIDNQTYRNETVHLDGKWFRNCTFYDVTFAWDGDHVRMNDNKISGHRRVQLSDPTAKNTAEILFSLTEPKNVTLEYRKK